MKNRLAPSWLGEVFPKLSEFEIMLEDARMGAESDFQEEFVKDVAENYRLYGDRMFWSERQDALLRKIAGTEDF